MDDLSAWGLKHSDRCEELAHPDIANFVVSWLILIGILVSYAPQHYRIIHRRTSEGISPYFVLLGTVSGTSAIANILTLPTSRQDIACCKVNSGFSCAAGLLGIAQVGVQWSCFFVITFLFLIFVPRRGLRRHGHNSTAESSLVPTNDFWQRAVAVVAICILHFAAVFIISVIMLGAYPQHLSIWADILGIMGSFLASIQYIPQIYTTWDKKSIGSFSIPMMCIQTPGSFVFAASLAVRLGKGGWSAWTVYLVTGCLQGILLIMAIIFATREREARKHRTPSLPEYSDEDDDQPYDRPEETDPLIISRRAAAEARRQPSAEASLLDPRRLDPEPSSPEDEGQNGKAFLGSGSSHTFHNVANVLAQSLGLGKRPRSQTSSRQEEHGSTQPSRAVTQYFDSYSRRESLDTMVGPETARRADSPFTTASRSISTTGSTMTAFRDSLGQTAFNASPSEERSTAPSFAHPRQSSLIPFAGPSNGSVKDKKARSKSTAR